jgi:hypothetical protein
MDKGLKLVFFAAVMGLMEDDFPRRFISACHGGICPQSCQPENAVQALSLAWLHSAALPKISIH